jgi:6-phosphogluconate dehydrogenase
LLGDLHALWINGAFLFGGLQVTHFLNNEAKGTNIIGATSLQDMVSKLKSPRRVMLLVKGEFFFRWDLTGI